MGSDLNLQSGSERMCSVAMMVLVSRPSLLAIHAAPMTRQFRQAFCAYEREQEVASILYKVTRIFGPMARNMS